MKSALARLFRNQHSAAWTPSNPKQTFRGVGHLFNAAMFYSAASNLASKGSNFRLGIWPEIEGEARNLRLPAELEGKAPYLWRFGIDSFRVLRVQPLFAGGGTDLTIRIEVPDVYDAGLTDERNHSLIRHFTNAYREVCDSFEAIVVEAVETDGV